MDWDRAIEINQTALSRIVAGLIAMVGLVGGGAVERLSRPVYRVVVRVLRPAESAVRRLIVIAARGVAVKLRPARSMPSSLALAGKGGVGIAFQLFDPRKRFDLVRRKGGGKSVPRIHVFGDSPFSPLATIRIPHRVVSRAGRRHRFGVVDLGFLRILRGF